MEFVNGPKPETVELHVKMDRTELRDIVEDMESDNSGANPYTATREFLDYLKSL